MRLAPPIPTPEQKSDQISKLFFVVFFGLDAAAAFGFLIHSKLGIYFAFLVVAWMALGTIVLAASMIERYLRKRDEMELRRMYSNVHQKRHG